MNILAKRVWINGNWHDNQTIEFAEGNIVAVRDQRSADKGRHVDTLVPGFIDVQVNGGGGVLFNTERSVDGLRKMMEAHRTYGTTAMMPTLITDSTETMVSAAKAVLDAKAAGVPGIVGIHFEGPWLSTAKKGVHSEKFIRPPSDEELELISHPELGCVMVTVAPENVSPAQITRLRDAGLHVFIGHTNATAEQAQNALQAGAVGFTHLYNAMSAMQSRAPGVVGVALADKSSYAGLIIDGYHADPVCCQVGINAKGTDRIMLVTDAMALAATDLQEVPFFDTVITRQGDKLTTPDGTLAGSCLTMVEAVRNAVNLCGCSLADAVKMASLTPATMLGLADQIGDIKPGAYADFIALDDSLNITALWHHGQEVTQ